MITLGGVTLPDLWFDPELAYGDTGVSSRLAVSRGLTPIVFEASSHFRAADLIGGADTAWMTHATLEVVHALASVPGAQYALDYESTIYQARFRNWDTPVISAVPLVGRPNPAAGDYYKNIRIRLLIDV